jgi:hypothetical protein
LVLKTAELLLRTKLFEKQEKIYQEKNIGKKLKQCIVKASQCTFS